MAISLIQFMFVLRGHVDELVDDKKTKVTFNNLVRAITGIGCSREEGLAN